MTNYTYLIHKSIRLARHHWLSTVAVLLALLFLSKGVPAWAAPALLPLNQTVPEPTATKENTPVPAATNTPRPKKDDNNNDNNDNNQEPPTPTPQQPAPQQPTPQQPAPADGPTGVVIADRLNVRQGPGTNFAPIGTVLSGQTVRVLNRNATGDWWRICCVNNTQTEGWVSARFIKPNFDAAQTNDLIPLAEGAPAPAPTATTATTITQSITPTATAQVVAAAAATTVTQTANTEPVTPTIGLQLSMEQTPTLVWQGQAVDIQFVLTNTTDAAVTNVELRDELPQELKFMSADVGGNGEVVPQTSAAGKYVVDVQWPELAAGDTVTATVKVQLAATIPAGAVIDNLAVAAAANTASNTAGISIGLPPADLPDFQ